MSRYLSWRSPVWLWFADYRDQHWETSHRGQVRLLREAVAEGYAVVG